MMTTTSQRTAGAATALALIAGITTLLAQSTPGVISGPTGPSPYDVVRAWHKPFSDPGFTFGGNSGVFAESPDRIFVAQRGEFKLPNPVPPGFAGFAGSIGVNVLSATAGRVWRNCLYTLGADGAVKERWTQWDSLCEGSPGPGPHRLRISPYDPEHRVWVVNETFNTIYVFSNDGSKLLKTLGEKNVPGTDGTHFGKPQDVAFLPDGRILVADGLDNHRVMILDKEMHYISEFGGAGKGPGQFSGVHALGVGPEGRIFALDRSGGRINVFKTTADRGKVDFVQAYSRLLAASRHHRQRRQHLGHRPQPAAVHQARFPGQPPLHVAGAKGLAGRLPRGPHVHRRLARQSLRRRQPVRTHAEVRAEAWRRRETAHPPAVGYAVASTIDSRC
jgi:hypothetical protein